MLSYCVFDSCLPSVISIEHGQANESFACNCGAVELQNFNRGAVINDIGVRDTLHQEFILN